MTDPQPILDAFALPPATLVDRRVPKTLLVENGAPTAADKRLIQDSIEELRWIASLKPNLVGIAAWTSPQGSYEEIAVLTATFREKSRVPRLTDLIHRAIPYPVVLLTLLNQSAVLSLAHKRLSQAESGKFVLEDEVHVSPPIQPESPDDVAKRFLESFPLHRQNAGDLRQLYQAWIDRIIAFRAGQVTGAFRPIADSDASAVVKDSLDRHGKLLMEIQSLRKQAAKERQLNRRADLNLKIKTLELELDQVKASL
ncbi:MAG: DUF4391 domain-containing protein [Akkermansiaceae bacterium]|nr:DUF4391 domain-containing protein [Akkermansiaceae bacterium]